MKSSMRPITAAIVVVIMFFLQTGLGSGQEEGTEGKSNEQRIRQLEEELKKIREEMKTEKKEPSKFPLKLGGSLTIRYYYDEVEDQTDLLLGDNETNGLRGRVRLGMEYNQNGRIAAGLRISTGENPNPTSPFIRLGDAFRSKSFNIDQFYIVYRPLKFFEDLAFVVGKMPQPFW